MTAPKPRPIIPLRRASSGRSDVLFNGMGDGRVLVMRLKVDMETEEVYIARCVAEGKVMRSISRAWFSLGRVGEVWDTVTKDMEFDWALIIPDSGMEFLLGHIGGSDEFLWADHETMVVESRSGIMGRLALGKPGVAETELKHKKKDVDLSRGNGKKIHPEVEEYTRPDPFGSVMMKADLQGLPEFRSTSQSEESEEFVAWTDGSYISNGNLRGVAVVTSTGHWVSGTAATGKIEYAEIYAILLAVSHGIRTKAGRVVVKSDSRAALLAVDCWLGYAEDKVTFKTTKMMKVLDRIRNLVERYPTDFKFTWVKGHEGNPGNESADRLARLTARREEVDIDGVSDGEARDILVDTGLFTENGELAI